MPGTLRVGMTRAQQSIDHERLFARCIFVDKEKERTRIDFQFQVEQQYERKAAAHWVVSRRLYPPRGIKV